MTADFGRRVAFFAGLAAVLAAGGLWISYSLNGITERVESDLSFGVEVASSALNADEVRRLSLDGTDKASEEYVALRQRFIRLGEVLRHQDIRGVYAMRVVGEEVKFIVDSAPDGDPWHSDPGISYEEPPSAVFDAQRSGAPKFIGPYSDEYGSFYSVFSPLRDSSGHVVAIIGGDVEAKTYDGLVSDRLRFQIAVVLAFLAAYFTACLLLVALWRRKREEAARELERQRSTREREALLMNINEGVVACDAHGTVTFVNTYAAKTIGARRGDVLGKPYAEFWLLADEKGVPLPAERQPFAKGRTAFSQARGVGYARLRRKDGVLVPVIVSRAVVRGGNGLAPMTVVTFRDYSREAEVDRMKSEFITVATHQIKTPLTALKWIAGTLAGSDAERSNEDKEAISQLNEAVRRLDELVKALLNAAQVESGTLALEPKPASLAALAGDVVRELSFRADEKALTVSLNVEKGMPDVECDARFIREVYKNLLSNAVKYTPRGGHVTVTIAVEGKKAVSTVKDDGYGIPESEHERVFAKFFRGSNVIGLDEEGNGLGLYFARQVVEASGGRLWFESAPGKGTAFHFSLPLAGGASKKRRA